MTREERRQPVYLFLLALAINGIALALSQNYLDGDAHTRTYMALQWLKSPFFIYQPNEITWVFGPLHCYLNALILSVWNNPTLAPRLLSLVLTTLTIFPFYHSVRIVFSRREAFYTTLLFCFYTLFIHPAAIAVGEGINLLLVFLSIWLFLRCRESGNRRDLFLCALTLMLASAMRYESWLLPPFFVLLFLFHRYARAADMRTLPFLHLGAFALLSHAFILMWMISCWATWGDPVYFLHYSGNLDMPVIAAKIEQSGILKLMLYNLAFLPAVMLLSFPVTTLAATVVGFVRFLRNRRRNLFLALFGLYVAFYLVVFVFSLQRYPLARLTTVPGALFFAFVGSGIVYLRERLRYKLRRLLLPLLLVVAAINLVALGFYSQPSDSDLEEKLRAVSPLTNPPAYFRDAVNHCNHLLAAGSELALDCRNYNDRLLYLSLYHHHDQLYHDWCDNEQLSRFIKSHRPEYVLFTSYPRNNHDLFELFADGDSARIAGISYLKNSRFEIFTLYRLAVTANFR